MPLKSPIRPLMLPEPVPAVIVVGAGDTLYAFALQP